VSLIPLFIGTYTRRLPHVEGQGTGIYSATFDTNSGHLSQLKLAASAVNPSYLCVAKRRNMIYCVNEGVDDQDAAGLDYVSAYSIDPTHATPNDAAWQGLTEVNRQPARGAFPCHITIDSDERVAIVSNYGTGNIVSFPILQDGSLGPGTSHQHLGKGPNKTRQEGPHAHGVFFRPQDSLLIATDLGIDAAMAYRLEANSPALLPEPSANLALPLGSGPRHASWSPSGSHVLIANELNSTVNLFSYRKRKFSAIQTISTLPDHGDCSNSIAAIRLSEDGLFAYVSNRGHDSIAVFHFDEIQERLTVVQTVSTNGKNPRDIALAPGGQFLLAANQDSNSIYSYEIDCSSGELSPLDTVLEVPTPVSLSFGELETYI
jgi:6-phosphogluconolactonase